MDFFLFATNPRVLYHLKYIREGESKVTPQEGWPKGKVCVIIYANVEINQIIAIKSQHCNPEGMTTTTTVLVV